MSEINLIDLTSYSPVINSDEGLWGTKLNNLAKLSEEKFNELINAINYILGVSNIFKVEEYPTKDAFPLVGENYTIYFNLSTNTRYMWGGSTYIDLSIGDGSVTSVNGYAGNIVLTKSDVGLSNVDNTSDLNKVISTATQTALNTKANSTSPVFTGTVTLPSTTSIGLVDSTEISYLDGVTSGIQVQLNNKQPLDSGLTAISNLSTNGIVVKTGSGTAETRSIAVSGTGLSVSNGDGISGNPTITSNATETNTPSTIVARDSSGNFNAGTISATLNGKANTADTLQTSRTIGIMTGDVTSSGSSFNGGANNTNTTTIANNVVDNNKLSDMPTKTLKGNDTLITDNPKDLTVSEVQTLITDSTHRFVTDTQISQWNSTSSLVKSYETVALMQADQANLPNGSVVETLGYTTVNDGLGRKYIITATDVDGLGIVVGSYYASKYNGKVYNAELLNGENKATMFASPTFTGTPTAPTATAGETGQQLANLDFVNAMLGGNTVPAISKADNGYVKMANGIIIQWGNIDVGGNAITTVTFPLAFPNACVSASAILNATLNLNESWSCHSLGKTTMLLRNSNAVIVNMYWIAIGY